MRHEKQNFKNATKSNYIEKGMDIQKEFQILFEYFSFFKSLEMIINNEIAYRWWNHCYVLVHNSYKKSYPKSMLHQLCKSHNNPILVIFEQFSLFTIRKKILIFLDNRRKSKSHRISEIESLSLSKR